MRIRLMLALLPLACLPLACLPPAALPSTPYASAAPDGGPAPAAPSAPAAPAALTPAQIEAEKKLARLLLKAANFDQQTDMCMDLAWGESEPDQELRAAALRRLQNTETRLFANRVVARIDHAPEALKLGMLQLMEEIFSGMGGLDDRVNSILSEQIRSPARKVASTAMTVCTRLKLTDAYIPMREIASTPGSPLRKEAIQGLGGLGDPRAVVFLTKLLQTDTDSRDEIYRALGSLGRPASLFLKSKLDDKKPDERRRALDALLAMASPEDLSSLYTYLQKYPPEGDLKTRIYETIARVEAAEHERRLDTDSNH